MGFKSLPSSTTSMQYRSLDVGIIINIYNFQCRTCYNEAKKLGGILSCGSGIQHPVDYYMNSLALLTYLFIQQKYTQTRNVSRKLGKSTFVIEFYNAFNASTNPI